MTVTHHLDPALVDDGEGAVAQQLLVGVLVDAQAVHDDLILITEPRRGSRFIVSDSWESYLIPSA